MEGANREWGIVGEFLELHEGPDEYYAPNVNVFDPGVMEEGNEPNAHGEEALWVLYMSNLELMVRTGGRQPQDQCL